MKKEIEETAASASLEDVAAGAQAVDEAIEAELAPLFAQQRSLDVAWDYVSALSDQIRANCWSLAEAAGHGGWGRLQALLRTYVWDHEAVRELLPGLAGRWLTCPGDDPVGPGGRHR